MSTSMDNIRIFVPAVKDGIQDVAQRNTARAMIQPNQSQQVSSLDSGNDALKNKFKPGLFDARPKTGTVGPHAPLSERTNTQPHPFFSQMNPNMNQTVAVKNVSELNKGPASLTKRSFRIR